MVLAEPDKIIILDNYSFTNLCDPSTASTIVFVYSANLGLILKERTQYGLCPQRLRG